VQYTEAPESPSIYDGAEPQPQSDSFAYWYAAYTFIYESAPRSYLEKEITFLDQQIIKMGRGYHPRLVASRMAAKDVHHTYYDGRKRDPERDDTISRGPMYTGQGRKNTGQRLGHPCQPGESPDG
jgi:hypothetical protein